jgi:hypothetical protein
MHMPLDILISSHSCVTHNILEPTTGATFFNSGFKSDPTELFPSIVVVIAGEKRFPPPNFNLKIVRIQRGGGSWILLDAVFALLRRVCWPALEECYAALMYVFLNSFPPLNKKLNCSYSSMACKDGE